MAPLPVSALSVTSLSTSVRGPPGGPSSIGASKIPPPWTVPPAPFASIVFPLTSLFRNVRPASSTTIAPPAANAVPLGLEAWTWLSLMRLFVIDPKSMIAPAKAVASPADEVTVTVLPVKRVLLIVPSISPAPESPSALPDEPASVAELTLLSETTLLLIVKAVPRFTWTPPENASASPTAFVILTELPEIVESLIPARRTSPLRCMPPPLASSSTLLGSDASRAATLSVTELLLILSVPSDALIAPPSANRAFAPVALARLPWMNEPSIVRGPRKLVIAPPSASLASVDRPDAEPTKLSLTVVLRSVSVPQLSIPPPPANANGQGPPGQGGPNGAVPLGATRLPVMTLFAIVTVAPPLKSALGGISTPPPAANTPSWPVNGTDSGLDRVMPPVIVTPSIETVGSAEAPNS